MLHLLLSICQGDTQFRAKCSPAFLRLLWREPQLFVTAMFRRHVLAFCKLCLSHNPTRKSLKGWYLEILAAMVLGHFFQSIGLEKFWSEFVNESQCFSLFYYMNPAGKPSRLCEQKQSKRTDFYTGQYNNLYISTYGLSFWLAYIYRLLLQLTSQPKRILSRIRLTANTPFWAEPKLVCAIR